MDAHKHCQSCLLFCRNEKKEENVGGPFLSVNITLVFYKYPDVSKSYKTHIEYFVFVDLVGNF